MLRWRCPVLPEGLPPEWQLQRGVCSGGLKPVLPAIHWRLQPVRMFWLARNRAEAPFPKGDLGHQVAKQGEARLSLGRVGCRAGSFAPNQRTLPEPRSTIRQSTSGCASRAIVSKRSRVPDLPDPEGLFPLPRVRSRKLEGKPFFHSVGNQFGRYNPCKRQE